MVRKLYDSFKQWYVWRDSVTIEVREITYQSHRAILTEWNDQNAWLPRHRVKIEQKNGKYLLTIPRKLFSRKFGKSWN